MEIDPKTELLVLTVLDEGAEVRDAKITVTKIIFSNGDFVIFSCKGNYTVKGYFNGLVAGGTYLVTGKVSIYQRTPQIVAESITKVQSDDNDATDIAAFLEDNFDGIGKKSALELAKKYGTGVLEKIELAPDNLAKEIKGLSLARAKICSEIVSQDKYRYEMIMKLRMMSLTQKQSEAAISLWGLTAYDTVKQDPYALQEIRGIGFETCERIAEGLKCDPLSLNRIIGAISYKLEQEHISGGSTYFAPDYIRNQVLALVGDSIRKAHPEGNSSDLLNSMYDEAVSEGIKQNRFVVYKFDDNKCKGCEQSEENSRIALKKYFLCELAIKKEVESFLGAKRVSDNRAAIDKKINKIASEKGITLADKQLEALEMCLTEPFSIITGGPGTGKTTIMGILAEHLSNENISCEFCAPTGRAAKRLAEATGKETSTLHRLLGVTLNDDSEDEFFARNRENPIDARVVIVDESSMIDVEIFKALLYAIKKDASVILIGDPDQLPSVSPGNVLRDLLSCVSIPRVELQYVFRQENESSIPANAVRILEGREVIGNNDDFIVISTKDDDEAEIKVAELFAEYYSKDKDVAILTPTRQNILGTVSLNKMLQVSVAADLQDSYRVNSELTLYLGDRVMQIHNNYKIEYYDPVKEEITSGVFNGEIGTVEELDETAGECLVKFDDGKTVLYEKKLLEDINLAYAMTVHKAQGCEFDTIIIALGKMHYKLSSRKLIYTAVTRGKKKVIIVDSAGRLNKMIKSVGREERYSSLGDFLKIVDSRHL